MRNPFRHSIEKTTTQLKETRPAFKAGKNSFHYRIYSWWKNHGGQWYSDTENLCHYMRVVLIWAPWRWLWYVPLWKSLTPGGVLSILSALIALVIFLIISTEGTLIVLGAIFVACLFVISGLIFSKPLIRLGTWFTETRYKFTFIRPFTISLVFALALMVYFWGIEFVLVLLAAIGIYLGTMAVLLGVVLLIMWLISKFEDRKTYSHTSDTSTRTLLWEFSKATKNKILCPLIYLPSKE